MAMLLVLSACFLSSCKRKDDDKDEPQSGEFVPVLRFAVTSDVHVRSTSNDYGSRAMLDGFLNSAYAYASGEEYSALDGIFIVGDLTQDGKTGEYDILMSSLSMYTTDSTYVRMVMGNHELHGFGRGDERFTPENIAKSTERFKTKLGYESENSHKVINGYHFITLANDSYETHNFYSDESLAWLKGEIEAAMADDPAGNKPIFVMNHEPPYGDVRGFTGGDTKLGELLRNYPRVVDFSGHTHRSIIDPQSIWQDGFTAIGTGSLSYLGLNMAGHPTLDNNGTAAIDDMGGYIGGASNGERNGAMYYIVEVDASNNIRLKIYDLLTGGFYGEPITFRVGDEPVFTPDRAERSVAPAFGEGAAIEVLSADYNYPLVKFSTPTSGDLTQYYRIELWGDGDAEPAAVSYRLADIHKAADPPATLTVPLRGYTKAGAYTVKIYAINCWAKESAPLVGSITIGEPTLEGDILKTVFDTNGTASSGGESLISLGLGGVTFDEELGRNVASFGGTNGYKFTGIANYYDRIGYAVSLEAYFKVGEGVEENVAIASNTNSSGFGLVRLSDGTLRFNYSVNNGGGRSYLSANTAPGTASEGEWVHAVAVVGGGQIKIYVNGEQAELYNADGVSIGNYLDCSGRLFEAPTGLASALVVGGDISSSGGMETGFIGDIAALNVFSRALTDAEVAELYTNR